MDIQQRVQAIFRELFEQPELVVNAKTNADDIEDWDSVSHISLVVMLEKEFKIRFALGELQNLKNVGEMLALIEEKCR